MYSIYLVLKYIYYTSRSRVALWASTHQTLTLQTPLTRGGKAYMPAYTHLNSLGITLSLPMSCKYVCSLLVRLKLDQGIHLLYSAS